MEKPIRTIVEITEEIKRCQSRIQEYTIPVAPSTAQVSVLIVERAVKSGLFAIDELESIAKVAKELKSGLENYNQSFTAAEKTLQILSKELEEAQDVEVANRAKFRDDQLATERSSKKELETEIQSLKSRLSELTGPKSIKTSKPIVSKSVLPIREVVDVPDDVDQFIIPSKSELESMTKSQIEEQYSILGFPAPLGYVPKAKMIDDFIVIAEQFVEKLLNTK